MLQIPGLFSDESSVRSQQELLDALAIKEIGWDQFLEQVSDLSLFTRLSASQSGRSLLHLAILDGQLEVTRELFRSPFLRQHRDRHGLSPVEIAQFLGLKEFAPALDCLPLPVALFETLHAPLFESREHLETVLHWTAKAKGEDLIPAEKIWMGVYFDKEIQKGLHPQLSVKKVNEEVGFGVFADKKILPCSFIGEYTGLVQERSRENIKGKKYLLRYTLWESKKQFTMDAEKMGNFTRYINHSTRPNVGLQSVYWRGIPRMIFVALKEINVGDQLTFDYGSNFWKEFDEKPHDL